MKYDIEALKRKMLVKYPFFGSVIASVGYKEDKDISTAGTDGEIIYYNPKYLEKLSIEEQIFVFAHEVCHIAFNHILRSEGKDQDLWNIATDAVINQFLKRDGLKLAQGVVDIADAINYDAEQLYEKLLQEKQHQQQSDYSQSQNQNQENQNQQQSGTGQSSDNQQKSQSQQQGDDSQNQEQNQGNQNQQQSGTGQGSDSQQKSQSQQQSDYSQSQEQNQENQNQQQSGTGQGSDNQQSQQQSCSGEGSSQEHNKQNQGQDDGGTEENKQEGDKPKQDVGHDTHSMWEQAVKKHKEQQEKSDKNLLEKEAKEKTELKKKQEELEKMGEKDAFKKNLENRKKQLEELKEAISKQVSQAGFSTNSNVRIVNDIGFARPLIDWRYVLRETIKYDVDWSYKNATIEDGVVTANLEEQPMPETELELDTSGSINAVLLKNFLRECKNILKHTKLKVGCFDTKFYGFHEIRTEEDIENMKFVGGGGTNFDVAVEAFSRRVENKIIFTDGKASMPEMSIDAIWIVFGGEQINPKGGKVIHITPEQLDRLYSYEITSETKGRIR